LNREQSEIFWDPVDKASLGKRHLVLAKSLISQLNKGTKPSLRPTLGIRHLVLAKSLNSQLNYVSKIPKTLQLSVILFYSPGAKFPPEKLFEYQWPPDKGDFFMLQEQISEYLGVKSFKRKYPDLPRKMVDITERNFLKDKGIVTEMQCDLGKSDFITLQAECHSSLGNVKHNTQKECRHTTALLDNQKHLFWCQTDAEYLQKQHIDYK
jgi:hypothetical protein